MDVRSARRAPRAARGERHPPRGLVIATLALCGTVTSLQNTMVLPLLPELPRLLDTTPDTASWMITGTLLTGAIATPVISRLADLYGKRPLMTVCLLVMVTGSVLGALSESIGPAITARALQGVGVALVPVGIAAMRDELPAERRAMGVSLMSATLAVGGGLGLPLSGLIVANLDWHALFWTSAGAGAVMLIAVPLILAPPRLRSGGSFDYWGALLLSAGLTGILLALSQGGSWGWTSWATLGPAVVGIVVLTLWIPLQLRSRAPIIDVRTARRPAILLVNIISVLIGFGMFANLLVTAQLLQLPTSTGFGLGLDILHAGLWMAPTALAFGVMAPVTSAIINRLGGQVTLLLGSLSMCFAYIGRALLHEELWQIVAGTTLVAVGTSLTFSAMPTLIMLAVPARETSSANGLNTLLRSVGTALSSAALAALVSLSFLEIGGVTYPSLTALTAALWLSVIACGIAAAIAVPVARLSRAVGPRDDDERADPMPAPLLSGAWSVCRTPRS